MSESVQALVNVLNLGSNLTSLCFTDMDNENAKKRVLGGYPNSFVFVVGHLITGRCNLGTNLGLDIENPFEEHFGFGKSCDDGANYPDIEEVKDVWNSITEKISERLKSMTEAEFTASLPDDAKFPVPDQTIRGVASFYTFHECYHVGQLGAIRSALKMTTVQELVGHK